MATYNFYLSGNNLGIETRNSNRDITQNQSIADAGVLVDYFNNYITVTSGGSYHSKYLWTEGGVLVDDAATTDLAEADSLINALGFNSGGGSSSNTSVVPYFASPTYDDSGFISVPANTVILSVYNVSDGVQLTESTQWSQSSAGSNVSILGGAADLDVLQLSGWTYANVTPPTTKEFVMYVGGQDNTGFLDTEIRKNTFPFVFEFVRIDAGQFTITNFDPEIHYLEATTYRPGTDLKYLGEFSYAYTLSGVDGEDSVFEFGGFIRITEY